MKVTRRGVVTVHSADGRRSGMGEVTLVMRVRQGEGLIVALLTEARLVWTSGLCTLRVYTVVCAMVVFLVTPGVEASVVLGAIVGRARQWRTRGL